MESPSGMIRVGAAVGQLELRHVRPATARRTGRRRIVVVLMVAVMVEKVIFDGANELYRGRPPTSLYPTEQKTRSTRSAVGGFTVPYPRPAPVRTHDGVILGKCLFVPTAE